MTDSPQTPPAGGGTIFTEPILVVNQKAKLIEINNEYAISDQNGTQIGAVREVGQSKAKKVLRVLTSVDQFLTHRLEVVDSAGQVLLALTRPAKLVKSKVIVQDGQGNEVGTIVQQNAIGKIRFNLDAGGQTHGSINAENWRAWNFNILDAQGEEVARITKTWEGLAKTMFTTADNYVVHIHRPLTEPLRSLVVASSLAVDTALKQDSRGLAEPMALADPYLPAVRDAVTRALAEDLAPLGDLTSALLPHDASATAHFVPRHAGIIAGTACATEAFAQLDPAVEVTWTGVDGTVATPGTPFGSVSGPLAAILTAERTALNFLCHLSGIATLTRRFVDAAAEGGGARIWDTRKTTPGLRTLEKAAVRAGGATNHRANLSDWVMFKDNHLAVLGIAEGVAAAKVAWPGRLVHVEAGDLDELRQALEAGADAVLLDNMTPEEAKAAVALAEEWAATHGSRPLLECSGGITLETAAAYSATGVDLLSTSQITQSAPALDIGLDILGH